MCVGWMRLFKHVCLDNDPLSEMTSWGSSTGFITWNYHHRNYHGYCLQSHWLCLKTPVCVVCVCVCMCVSVAGLRDSGGCFAGRRSSRV